jgi:hypothetical protein
VDVEKEARRRGSHRLRPGDRIHLDDVTFGQTAGGRNGVAVDAQGADLCQWHADGLDDVPE